ncbi:uncharacterized protein CEXT_7031 [Caerostris extrusa]|uniref:Uncharacterized protein n=1 Tax=Caerostris extrusa TaxID=172846 RepID=A0AAV4NAV7_CAEEX|nr:uncharacterized protein CEXT_7031 [Caerostris extrusa]
MECLQRGARECNIESDPIVQDLIEVYNSTCILGMEMNILYKKHGECVFRDAARGNSLCLKPVKRELRRLGVFRSEESSFRVICKYQNSTNECVDKNTYSTCGEEAMRFRQRLSNSSIF